MSETTRDPDRPLPEAALADLILKNGGHSDRSNGLCLMEVVAWVAGEPHSDQPRCVSPVLGAFGRSFNDGLNDDQRRTEMLRPFVPRLVGTAASAAIEERRAFMAMDWLIRVHTPAWLELREVGRPHASALRAAPAERARIVRSDDRCGQGTDYAIVGGGVENFGARLGRQ